MGYFVPETLDLEQLVYDPSQLPEWFEFVFKKEYEKQKKSLDALCKKAYKMQSLSDVFHLLYYSGSSQLIKINPVIPSLSLTILNSLTQGKNIFKHYG